jgi:hypothetical protein
MNRWISRLLVSTILVPPLICGCGSQTEDAAAKWDGKEPVAGPPPSKKKDAPPSKRVRGFMVPTVKE